MYRNVCVDRYYTTSVNYVNFKIVLDDKPVELRQPFHIDLTILGIVLKATSKGLKTWLLNNDTGTHLRVFQFHGSVHHNSILIESQLDVTVESLIYFTAKSLYMFSGYSF
jgi:hypothetical protein